MSDPGWPKLLRLSCCQQLVAAARDWLARPITRCVLRPEWPSWLERQLDVVDVVVDMTQAA